jgi:hypothetical protein
MTPTPFRYAVERIRTRFAPRATRERERDQAQDAFEREARALADRLSSGQATIPQWEAGMRRLISAHLVRQALLGSPTGRLSADQLQQVDTAQRRQFLYLTRFAFDLAARQHVGRPLGAVQTANRAALYSGSGRAAFFVAQEAGAEPGYIARYTARDDGHTCANCIDAEGDYLPSAGPFPSQVCLGRGRCRCTRALVYDPVAYQRLRAT